MRHIAQGRPSRLAVVPCIVVCLALLLGLVPTVAAQGPAPTAPPPTSRPSAVRGKDLFATNCVPCHGPQGRGDGETLRSQGRVAPNFAEPRFHQAQPLTSVYSVISEGRIDNLMPPWKNRLTPDQMWDVATYSWWLGTGSRTLARGQTVWGAECATCHGPTGAGVAKSDLSQLSQTIGLNQTQWATRAASIVEHAPVWAKLAPADQMAALAFARSLGFETPALPTATGVIQGNVQLGTPGVTLQPGQVVSATLFTLAGSDLDSSLSVPIAPDGTFKFDGLLTEAEYSYGVRVRYKDVDYFSPLVRLAANAMAQPATVTVYDTTTTDPGLRIARAHVIAEFLDTQTLRIGELYEVENPGQRTLIAAPGGSTFDLTLPSGAVNVRFQDEGLDEQKVRTGDQLRIALPWSPGRRQFLLSYDLPYRGQVVLTRAWPYPVTDANVLLADVGVQVQAEGLQARPTTQSPSGPNFLTYGIQSVAARQPVTLRLSGTPRFAEAVGSTGGSGSAAGVRLQATYQDSLRWLGLALALVGLVSVLAWPRLRPTVDTGQKSLVAERERLLDLLADLDDAHAASELTEAEYTVQRADAKTRLVQVMRTQRLAEGDPKG